jgi:hypothetical protein
MKRQRLTATAGVVAGLVVASATAGLAASSTVDEPAMTARAFSAQAEGFPIEPAPGMNATSLGIRPLGTRGSLSNAPAAAYGRATTTDLGTVELYTGPPPPGNTAECDATRPNLPRDAEAHPSGALLAATCTPRPSVSVSARAEGPRTDAVRLASQSSHIAADGGGPAVQASADVVITDVELGPIQIGMARFRGRVSANGRPGGASATGVVNAVDASVSGVPVVVGTGGVTVDRTRVPTDLVSSATDGVRVAMAHGGYSDVRIVQPRVTKARDGTSASVQGGGVVAFFSNNDPKNDYFLSLTLVGATLKAFVGAPVGPGGRDGMIVGSAPAPPLPAAAGGGGVAGEVVPGSDARSTVDTATPAAGIEPLVGRTTYEMPRPWRGGWLILVLAIVATGVVLLLRKRVLPAWDDFATRFLRG